jgi:hypothetical protein
MATVNVQNGELAKREKQRQWIRFFNHFAISLRTNNSENKRPR